MKNAEPSMNWIQEDGGGGCQSGPCRIREYGFAMRFIARVQPVFGRT